MEFDRKTEIIASMSGVCAALSKVSGFRYMVQEIITFQEAGTVKPETL